MDGFRVLDAAKKNVMLRLLAYGGMQRATMSQLTSFQ
jgi:hypothetical protein